MITNFISCLYRILRYSSVVLRNKSDSKRIALVLSAINVRRLLPGLRQFVAAGRDYWLVDLYRPAAEICSLLDNWQPAGLLTEWIPGLTEAYLRADLPTVLVTSRQNRPGTVGIDVDNQAVGRLAADYWIANGWPNLAFFGNDTPYSIERETGFAEVLADKGLKYHRFLEAGGFQRQYIEHWHESDPDLLSWLETLPKPCAVFAAHDPLGRSLAEACRKAEIPVPESIGILGVNDDQLVCEMTNPPLSSIAIPWERLAHIAGQLLESALKNPAAQPYPELLPPGEIVERRSSELSAIHNPVVQRALNWIRENACNGATVKDLVSAHRISRRQLEQAFRQHLKRTPKEEILRIRINRARELLRTTDWNITRIAEHCGFQTPERFSINFRRQTTHLPSAYRKLSRNT